MAATERRSEAIWIESRKMWLIKVQKDGVRKPFQSSTPGRKGKREAEAMADEWLTSGKSDMPFLLAWEKFLDYQLKQNGSANYRNHESIGRIHLLPNIRTTKLSKIKPLDWQRCIDIAEEKGLSKRTVTNIRGSITAFLAYADRERWQTIELKKKDIVISDVPEQKEKKILQPDDVQKLMQNSTVEKRGKEYQAFYIHSWRFTVLTGMRRGEVYGLQWDDLHGDVVSIARSINTLNEMTNGKNSNARRDVKLSSMAMQTLQAQRNMLDAMGIQSEWVFPDEWGERSDPNRAYKQWQFFCRTHGVSSTIHEMRHTYISMMKNDMPEQMLKDLVGHSVSMDTYATYGHVVNTEMERAKQIMDATFQRFLGGVDLQAPAELPPQVGKVARGHIDTRHTDAIKAQERRPRLPVKTAQRGRPRKKANT